MVVAYLERIRDKFIKEQIDTQSRLEDLLVRKKENIAFVQLLEENTDANFEVFTPRTVNTFHKRKIEELKNELETIEVEINHLESILQNIENELEEVNLVLKDAMKRLKIWCLK